MGTNGFKEAKRVELHDAGVSIFQKGEGESTWYSWREWGETEGGSFVIPDESIQKITYLAGGTPVDDPPEYLQGGIRIIKERQHIGDPIDDKTALGLPGGGQETIKAIFARVETANLLTMRITFSCENTSESEDHIQEVTYSGNFTVWWA